MSPGLNLQLFRSYYDSQLKVSLAHIESRSQTVPGLVDPSKSFALSLRALATVREGLGSCAQPAAWAPKQIASLYIDLLRSSSSVHSP